MPVHKRKRCTAMGAVRDEKKDKDADKRYENYSRQLESNVMHVNFLILLRDLSLYRESYEGESIYWEYVSMLHNRMNV